MIDQLYERFQIQQGAELQFAPDYKMCYPNTNVTVARYNKPKWIGLDSPYQISDSYPKLILEQFEF